MASNIRVTLEIDNKKYIAGVKEADRVTQAFGTAAGKAANTATPAIAKLTQAFGGLRAAIAGVAFGSLIAQSLKFADSIQDISDATGLASNTILGFGSAVAQAGGNFESAQTGILKFSEGIGEAIAGSAQAQKAFQAVGVTLTDLQSLSDQELLGKTIQGLGKMDNAASRIKAQVDLFGKSARSLNFPDLAGKFGPAVTESAKYASAIKAGADAQQSMENNMKNLTQALTNVLEPLNKIVAGVNVSVGAFESLIKSVVAIGSAFLIFGRVIPAVHAAIGGLGAAITAGGGVIALFTGAIMGMVYGLVNAIKNFGRFIGVLASGQAATASLVFGLKGLLVVFLRFTGIAGVIYAIVEAVNFLSKAFFNFDIVDTVVDKFDKLYTSAKKYFGIRDSGGAGAGRGGNAETTAAQIAQGEKLKKQYDEEQARMEAFKKRQAEMRSEVEKIGDAYAKNHAHRMTDLELENLLVGKTEEQIELFRALDTQAHQLQDTIEGLNEKRKEYAKGTPEQQANVGLIDAEIAKLKELSEARRDELIANINALQGSRTLEKARLADIENLIKAMEEQKRVQESLGDLQRGMIAARQDVDFAGTQANKSPFQAQVAEIRENARKAALAAGEAFAAAFEDTGDGMTPERAAEFAKGLKAIQDGYKGIADKQLENLEASRSWNAGWEKAFGEYKDNAQNAANQSATYFATFTQGFEDAIVKFVQTGKLSFKDLANSLIADFTRIQAKKLLVGLMDMGSGGGGFLSTIFGGGRATGGPVGVGGAYMVGERGPEMFVPRNAGTIVPNSALSSGSVTQVTYNIQAADAASFRQMIARDPEFLYAVTEKGRSGVPGGRR